MSKTKNCRCCSGSGKELDHKAVGAEMKALREMSGLSQAKAAAKMGFAPPYLCDLENGNRNWRPELIVKYKKALA